MCVRVIIITLMIIIRSLDANKQVAPERDTLYNLVKLPFVTATIIYSVWDKCTG